MSIFETKRCPRGFFCVHEPRCPGAANTIERKQTQSEVAQYLLEMNQMTASLTALRQRGHRIWTRAMRGDEALSRDEIKAMRLALKRLQDAATS